MTFNRRHHVLFITAGGPFFFSPRKTLESAKGNHVLRFENIEADQRRTKL